LTPSSGWRSGPCSAIEAGPAGLIAVATYSPFGEPERATGRWLPWLRLGTALALTAVAVGVLAAAAAAENLPGGTLDLLRNVAGITGIGLLCAAVVGGMLAWVGPMAYTVVTEFALTAAWTTPWIWSARPPHDHGAAICAALVFAAGIAVTTVRGARDSARELQPPSGAVPSASPANDRAAVNPACEHACHPPARVPARLQVCGTDDRYVATSVAQTCRSRQFAEWN
jgi:hypothetical protein